MLFRSILDQKLKTPTIDWPNELPNFKPFRIMIPKTPIPYQSTLSTTDQT